jgi:RimJ/RimL family protein N-acetyltransferase
MIRVLQPGDEEALKTFLQPRIESSMFLVGNLQAAGLLDNGRPHQGTYAAVFEQEQIVGVAALFWNGSLILQAAVELLDGLWQTAVAAAPRPMLGVLGPQQQVQAVLDSLKIMPAAIQLDEPENLYSLHLADLRVPAKLQSGEWRGRRVQHEDIALLTRWMVGYGLEALGETDSPELWQQKRTSVQRNLERGRTWILEEQGQPVSTSSFNTTTAEIVQVGGVWTPPDLRRRGYGRGAVAASLLAVRDEGVRKAILFTGEENIPAQRAYVTLGFRQIGEYRITLFKEPLSL